jgi:hypothetical protein
MRQPDNETRTGPNLNVVTLNRPFGLGDGCDEVSVVPNGISPVLCAP